MSRFRPTLTVDQYRQAARTLQVATAEAAWSLVVSPASVGQRRWRPLTAVESEELFDRLMLACSRFGAADRSKVNRGAEGRPTG